jgi:hypothetical protein
MWFTDILEKAARAPFPEKVDMTPFLEKAAMAPFLEKAAMAAIWSIWHLAFG